MAMKQKTDVINRGNKLSITTAKIHYCTISDYVIYKFNMRIYSYKCRKPEQVINVYRI